MIPCHLYDLRLILITEMSRMVRIEVTIYNGSDAFSCMVRLDVTIYNEGDIGHVC